MADGKTVGRHYVGPTWEHVDGSRVQGKPAGRAPGASAADIPWLKLEAVEPRGSGVLAGFPVIDLKKNATARARGYPEWKRMVYRQRTDRRAFRCRYRRRTLVEGVFGAVKRRFGEVVQARRRHAQRIEILCRVVVWNALGMVYDQMWTMQARRTSKIVSGHTRREWSYF